MNFSFKTVLIMFYLALIFSCAARSYPPGGEEDISPPKLTKVSPDANSKNLSNDIGIDIWFDEMLNPNTVQSSITIEPNIEFNIRVSGNKIAISPLNHWPEGMFKIFISRSLTDYSSNMNSLDYPIELLFSTTDYFLNSKIEGKIFNSDSTKIYQASLLDNDLNIISITDVDIQNYFKFSGVDIVNDNFFIFVCENKVTSPLDDIRSKKYGISQSFIDNKFQSIYISNPLNKAMINSISLKNNHYGEIVLSNNKKIPFILNNIFFSGLVNQTDDFYYYDYNFLDSLNIIIEEKNQLEKYTINYKYMFSDFLDTISPILGNHFFDKDSYFLEFDEPVLFDNKKSFKSNNKVINYKYITPLKIQLSISEFEAIQIEASHIKDLSGNILSDSLLVIQKNVLPVLENYIPGEINGLINYNGEQKIYVEIINSITKKVYKKLLDDLTFKFDDLESGNYYIFAYENINKIGNEYFPGMLDPLKLSAKFVMYDKMVAVRSNWINSIELKFE